MQENFHLAVKNEEWWEFLRSFYDWIFNVLLSRILQEKNANFQFILKVVSTWWKAMMSCKREIQLKMFISSFIILQKLLTVHWKTSINGVNFIASLVWTINLLSIILLNRFYILLFHCSDFPYNNVVVAINFKENFVFTFISLSLQSQLQWRKIKICWRKCSNEGAKKRSATGKKSLYTTRTAWIL